MGTDLRVRVLQRWRRYVHQLGWPGRSQSESLDREITPSPSSTLVFRQEYKKLFKSGFDNRTSAYFQWILRRKNPRPAKPMIKSVIEVGSGTDLMDEREAFNALSGR